MKHSTMPDCILARDTPASTDSLIPRIIYQTFETRDIAERMHRAASTWIELNPEYEYRFFTNDDRRRVIAENFAPSVLAAYDKLENGAFRADLWRYCQLCLTGGVYADVDSICERPLSQVIRPDDHFIAARADMVLHGLSNGFICSVPDHPFLVATISRAADRILKSSGPIDGYRITGPWGLGVSVNAVLGRRSRHPFDIGVNHVKDHHFRLLEKTSDTASSAGRLLSDGQVVLLTQYDGYQDDLSQKKISHWRQEEFYVKRSNSRARRLVRRLRKAFPGWI
ncbi:glycosyltransferase family 32 protein [Paracoccus shandongensis]|uniref:glycosyltransferase family 32 protein n=1 Tax=Paracoccus shandongensis TaxID=2816048 RepID=UPI001A90C3BC|nr:glycosyltransferase [Paracoccus shandongensis]